MAKKDKKDATPIEFYIPGPGKRPKIPIPINQPNWIYKWDFNSKPNIFEWFYIGIILAVSIGLGIMLILESMYKSFLWIVVVTFGVFAIFLVRSAIIRTINHKQEIEDDEKSISPSKQKRSFPNIAKITNESATHRGGFFCYTCIVKIDTKVKDKCPYKG